MVKIKEIKIKEAQGHSEADIERCLAIMESSGFMAELIREMRLIEPNAVKFSFSVENFILTQVYWYTPAGERREVDMDVDILALERMQKKPGMQTFVGQKSGFC